MRLDPIWPLWAVALLAVVLVGLVTLNGRWLLRRTADPGSRAAWGRRVALAAVLVLAVLGPSVPETTTRAVSNVEIYLVVDRTGSMAAEDYDGTSPRLDGVRSDIAAIRDAFPDARYSIIALDSTGARELPLTSDVDAVDSWVGSLHQEITDRSSGSSLERSLGALTSALASSVQNNPEDARLVYVLSDGEATDGGAGAADAQAQGLSWKALAEDVDGGAVLGYGTTEGGQMRSYDGTTLTGPGTDAPYITDPDTDAPAVSVIDEEELTTVADSLGVAYVHRTAPGDTSQFTSGIDVDSILSDGREPTGHTRYLVWPLGVVAVLLLVWEAMDLGRSEARLSRLFPWKGGGS